MSEDWLNQNMSRAYPLQALPNRLLQLPDLSTFALNDRAIVDFRGCVGLDAKWQMGTSSVTLVDITQAADSSSLTIRLGATGAAGLTGHTLDFVISLPAIEFSHYYAESLLTPADVAGPPRAGSCGDQLHYEGILIVGDTQAIASRIPPGARAVAVGHLPLELTLIDDLSASYIRSLNVANSEHYPPVFAPGCGSSAGPDWTGTNHSVATCLTGDLVIVPGSNLDTTQNPANGAVTLSAREGGGSGFPCDPTPRYPGEAATSLDCRQFITSVNGLSGPDIAIHPGLGVSLITTNPVPVLNSGTGTPTATANNTVIIDFDGRGLARNCAT